jgi:thiaminase
MTTPNLLTSWNLNHKLAQASTETLFIQHLAHGTLPAKNFDDWLYNDYVYVRSHIRFLARLISALPSSEVGGELESRLRAGYDVLGAELSEFRRRAEERGIDLPALAPVPDSPEEEAKTPLERAYEELEKVPGVKEGCKTHMRFVLLGLPKELQWTTLLKVFWLSEKVYCNAMWFVKEAPAFEGLEGSMRGFVGWWANGEFRGYVDFLEEAVRRVGGDEPEVLPALEELLKGEEAFWRMCEEGLE